MQTVISAVEARRSMGKWINTVLLKHEDVIIERDGKPVARLTSCVMPPAASMASGHLDIRNARGLGQDLWRGQDVAGYISKERDEWD